MTNMTNILNRAANTVEPPKQLPAGQYLFNVMSYADKDDQGNLLTSSGGHQKVDFLVQAIAPLEVDPAQMEGVNLPFRMRHSMVLTDNSLFRFRAFLEQHLGVASENMSLADMLKQAPGRQFRGTIVHRSGTRPGDTNLYANIQETFPVG